MRVLHLLASGGYGGIESLMRSYGKASKLDNIFVFVWGTGDIYDDMCNQGINCVDLNEKNGKFIHTVKAIIKKCDEIKPDVVVTHHDVAQFKAALMYLRVFNPEIKTIAYAHENGVDIAKNGNKFKSFATKKINELGFHAADGVVAISKSVQKSIEVIFKVPKEKIKVIYNGTDTKKIRPRVRKKIDDGVRLLYVGRLIEEKGVQTTIGALATLPASLKWTFDIVGDGPYRETLEQQVKKANLSKKVHFCGSCNNVPEILNDHDIFIHMPNWEEGFGITVIEAMAAGLVCICRRKGGIPEIIENGLDGVLVDSKEELVQVLEKMMSSEFDRSIYELSESALKKAEKFSIEEFARELDAYINMIFAK